MTVYFPNDTYDSQPLKHNFLSRIIIKSRFYFFAQLFINFYRIKLCCKRNQFDRKNQAFYSFLNFKTLERCGGQVHLRGLENLSKTPGPFVIVGNHMSSIETGVLNAIISPRLDFTFVIKRSLFHSFWMGEPMKAIDAIGVDRVNARDDFAEIISEGCKRLAEGKSVLIFPESTRQKEFLAANFNSVGIKLAKRAGVKILPFALKTNFMSDGLCNSEFGPLHPEKQVFFEFGEPIEITSNGKEEHNQIVKFIEEKTNEWKKLDPQ